MCCSVKGCVGRCAMPMGFIVMGIAIFLSGLTAKFPCEVDGAGACKRIERVEGSGAARCDEGVFLRVTKQPRIGLRHIKVDGTGTRFASFKSSGCTVMYSVECDAQGVQIREAWSCPGKQPPVPHLLGSSWEVCASAASSLTLFQPVVDLSFDLELSGAVEGCVAITAPTALPQLAAVRGGVDEQTDALVKQKFETGGCPTWRSDEDRLDRSEDYAVVSGGRLMVLAVHSVLEAGKTMALQAKLGTLPDEGAPTDLARMGALIALSKGFSGASVVISTFTCGRPTYGFLPVPSLQSMRHSQVAEMVADPKQARPQQIGGGYGECCFDKTLPVMQSSGEPPHMQVRKLWDTVGLATMHLQDVPEIPQAEPSGLMAARKALLHAVGMTQPMMDEVATVVAPLFLEMLWGKKPTPEQANTIAAYAPFGGLCIVGHLAAKLPLLPEKIKSIRAAALDFGKGSPVGSMIKEEIQKPEYKELRELYASRPLGVVDTAVQNLADASLFAGLLGTTTMSLNCLTQMGRGPKFVKMFRENSTAFLMETMRTATAVAGSIQLLREPLKIAVAFEKFELPAGAKLTQLTGLGGYDPNVFPDPTTFNTSRTNLGETMNWNGLTKYVFARDYSRAPRFCPGAAVSVKIAAKVCGHFSAHLSAEEGL